MSDSGTGNGWCAKVSSLGQWLQVDLGSSYNLQRIHVQGKKDSINDMVTKFRVEYSGDGVTWVQYQTVRTVTYLYPLSPD